MSIRFRVDASGGGKAAIWSGAGDRAPFDNPLANLSRVKFHSDLNYIQVIDERTFNVGLPARSDFKDANQTYPLYQHGRGGVPFVLGKLNIGGQPVAFCGSVPVQVGAGTTSGSGSPRGFARWVSLGADATWVYLYEYVVNNWNNSSAYGSYAALALPVTVWMTSEIF